MLAPGLDVRFLAPKALNILFSGTEEATKKICEVVEKSVKEDTLEIIIEMRDYQFRWKGITLFANV